MDPSAYLSKWLRYAPAFTHVVLMFRADFTIADAARDEAEVSLIHGIHSSFTFASVFIWQSHKPAVQENFSRKSVTHQQEQS